MKVIVVSAGCIEQYLDKVVSTASMDFFTACHSKDSIVSFISFNVIISVASVYGIVSWSSKKELTDIFTVCAIDGIVS